ncbi:MAG: ABC transporter permease [Alphaproteobacteria bacterium]|nr:ABC transporter permease [Alphaproteobacteria bacterium]
MSVSASSSTARSAIKIETPLEMFWADFCTNRIALIALALVIILALISVLSPWIAPQNPYDLTQISIFDNMLKPLQRSQEGKLFVLGSDEQGRDMLSAMMYGLKMSLFVAITATTAALCVGVSLGIIAAYFGGRVDAVLMRLVDLQLSFPAILIALILLAVLGKGVDKVIFALMLVQWAYYARTVRGNAMVERRREYIEAAQCLALPRHRIIFRHLLPNCLGPLIVVATVQVAHAISLEATLSFLGVGVPITEPSLGLLISNGYKYILSGKYWVSIYPGLLLLLTIVSINLVGDHLRDLLNPRLKA